MVTIGTIARPQVPPEQLIAVAQAAEGAGLAELWLWEDSFLHGGIASSAAMLGATSQLRVGIGVLPFPFRATALAAMEVATLARVFPGRFIAGFGHGVQSWMAQAGVRVDSFLTLQRESVDAMRALWRGEAVTTAGRYVTLDDVRLAWPPAAVPGIHLAAGGPKSLRDAGELGDGVILTSSNPIGEMPRIRGLLDEGRALAREQRGFEISVFVTPGDDLAAMPRLIDEWVAAGADRVVLEPREDEPDPVRFVELAAAAAASARG